MNCDQAKAELSAHLDGALPAETAATLAGHLSLCHGCSDELERLRGVGRLLRHLARRPLPPGFLARLEARRKSVPVRPALALALALSVFVGGLVLFRAARLERPSRLPAPAALAAAARSPSSRAGPGPARDEGAPLTKTDGPPETTLLPKQPDLSPPPAVLGGGEGRPAFAPADPGFDNSDQARFMQQQSQDEGLSGGGGQAPPSEGFLGRNPRSPEARARAEAAVRQLASLRRAIDESSGKPKAIAIAGETAPLLGADDERNGSALSEAPRAPASTAWEGRGDYSGGNEGTRTLSDPKAFVALWKTLRPDQASPDVDFAREEVVAIFLGERPSGGFRVEISELKTDESLVTVRWREVPPSPRLPAPEGRTTPYLLRVIPRSELPVRFEKIQ